VCCSVLQCAALCFAACSSAIVGCNALQCVALACLDVPDVAVRTHVYFGVLQCDAVCCSVVQCGAVWCNVVQCSAVWCGAVQCGAVWCSVVQSVAVSWQCVAVRCAHA